MGWNVHTTLHTHTHKERYCHEDFTLITIRTNDVHIWLATQRM